MYSLQVTLSKANGLAASDYGILGIGGKSDPYVTLKVGTVVQKSSLLTSNLNPVWSPPEVFQFDIKEPSEQILEVRVFDYDKVGNDDLLGSLNLALASFVGKKSECVSYSLEIPDCFAKQKCKSMIYLEISLVSGLSVGQTLELWENERFHIIHKWGADNLHGTERKRWSHVENNDISSDRFKEVAPDIPSHLEGDGWNLDVSQGDANGWIYAPAWSGPWQKKEFSLAMVRRRKWINMCHPSADSHASF